MIALRRYAVICRVRTVTFHEDLPCRKSHGRHLARKYEIDVPENIGLALTLPAIAALPTGLGSMMAYLVNR